MSTGSIQQGAPTTTTNPAQVSQQPYLDYGYQQSQNLYQNQPQQAYPGQSYAPINPYTTQGYSDLYATGQSVDQTLRPAANTPFLQATSGAYGVENSPAYGGYQSYATGSAYPQQQQQAIAQGAQNVGNTYGNQIGGYAPQQAGYAGRLAANNNLGLSKLGQTSSGYYLPGQAGANPYFDATVEAALQPLERSYQTVTDPTNAAAASASGRYGSGAQAGIVNTSQQNYLDAAGDITSKMSSDAYNAERQRQDAAASQYGQLYNQGLSGGISGLTSAANTGNQAGQLQLQGLGAAGTALNNYAANQQYGLTGLQSGYNTGNTAALQAMQYYPQLAAAQYSGANAAVQAGQGHTAQQQTDITGQMTDWQRMQAQPYTNLNTYLTQIGMGNPQAGSNTKTESAYTDPLMSGISGALGVGTLLANPAVAGSATGLFGSLGPLATMAW